jgi:hypothetical protein
LRAGRSYRCLVDAKLGHSGKWRTLVDFPLELPRFLMEPQRYLAYSNSPWTPSQDELERASRSATHLLTRIHAADNLQEDSP